MINTHEKFVLKTREGPKIEFEVNWSDAEEAKDSKLIRVMIGEEVQTIARDDLFGILMAIGSPKQQKKMLPVSVKNVKKLQRNLTVDVKLRKDMRAGEVLRVILPWIDEVPTEDEILAGNLNNRKPKLYGALGQPKS